ncbi:MAG TPA: MFS transporter [Paludibacteraceae bacterium]|nr:MFS transporter [Paludibacteraceae bacterium]HPT42517.1 MFS transporter [Paludibacteraceae bacterium]
MKSTPLTDKNINKTLLLVATMATQFFNPFMGAAVNVALKKIGTDFSMTAIGLSWVSMSYLLASIIFLVPFGKLGDTWGRTKMFLYGTVFFAITTLLCAFVPNSTTFIIIRFMQGMASAMMISTLMAIVISAYPPEKRGKMIGLNVSAVYVGSSLAPMIGGLITDAFSWRSIFLINAVVSTLIAILIIWKLNRELSETIKEKFDYKGTILYMISVSMLMYGLSKLPHQLAIVLTIAGIAGLFFFAKLELKTQFPVLNIRLFTENRVFALSNLSAIINYAATFSISFMLSLYLQYVKGMEAREAGLVLVAQPVLMAIVSTFSGRLSDKMNPRNLAALGMGISAIGLLILSFISSETTIIYIIIGLIVLGAGFGLFSSPNTNVVMGSVDKKIYGTASAILGTMRNTGMMFSMAIASLTLHLFLGNAQIIASNIPQLILSTKTVFALFTMLCFIGVFTSLVKVEFRKTGK